MKRFGRKLALNKETIENLTMDEKREVLGGNNKNDFLSLFTIDAKYPCPCEFEVSVPASFTC